MRDITGDLHIHTNISDGSYTTEEVIREAKELGLTHISIVNHDTINGVKEAIEIGAKYGITVISGVEISAYDYKNKNRVHILGYDFNLEGKNIMDLCSKTLENRNLLSRWQVETLINNGYKLDIKKLEKYAEKSMVLYKQHIMNELVNVGYTDQIYSTLYTELFKNKGICAKEIEYVDVIDAIKAIKRDGGKAVLAHPGEFNNYSIAEELIKAGLDGIEGYHPKHTKADVIKVMELCKKHNLIPTGGSDFHGKFGRVKAIGSNITPRQAILALCYRDE